MFSDTWDTRQRRTLNQGNRCENPVERAEGSKIDLCVPWQIEGPAAEHAVDVAVKIDR
jgi:hypothetical protein